MANSNPNLFRVQGAEELASGVYYEVDFSQAPIGVGGMGQVFRGYQVATATNVRKEVAIKFLYENLPASVVERAKREASIRIKNDNLVEMIAFVNVAQQNPDGTTTQRLHVVSELLRGVMLHDLIKGKTTDAEGNEIEYAKELLQLYKKDRKKFVITIGRKILSGLMALHDAGYIHRDIDPSNIMVTKDRKIKLIDFGIARAFNSLAQDHQLTSAGNFLGKAGYAAPELVLGDIAHQNETTDIYAMGIMLFQLFTGHMPFDGPASDVLGMQLNKEMPLNEVSDNALRSIIGKATQKSQSMRYSSTAEFRVDLDRAMNGKGSDPGSQSPFAGGNSPYAGGGNSGAGTMVGGRNPYSGDTVFGGSNPGMSNPGTRVSNPGTRIPSPAMGTSVGQGMGQTAPYYPQQEEEAAPWVWAVIAGAGLLLGAGIGFLM